MITAEYGVNAELELRLLLLLDGPACRSRALLVATGTGGGPIAYSVDGTLDRRRRCRHRRLPLPRCDRHLIGRVHDISASKVVPSVYLDRRNALTQHHLVPVGRLKTTVQLCARDRVLVHVRVAGLDAGIGSIVDPLVAESLHRAQPVHYHRAVHPFVLHVVYPLAPVQHLLLALKKLHPIMLPFTRSTAAGSLLIPAATIDHYAIASADRAGSLLQMILDDIVGGGSIPGESQTRLAFSLALSRYQARRPVQGQASEVRPRRCLALEQILHQEGRGHGTLLQILQHRR